MLATYCTNAECPELGIAKEVRDPEESGILCGGCGRPTTEPAETSADKGEAVR